MATNTGEIQQVIYRTFLQQYDCDKEYAIHPTFAAMIARLQREDIEVIGHITSTPALNV